MRVRLLGRAADLLAHTAARGEHGGGGVIQAMLRGPLSADDQTLTHPAAGAIDAHVRATSIEALTASPPRKGAPRTAPIESHVWRLSSVGVEGLEKEPDGDVHMVVSDSHGRTMIAGFPNAACVSAAPVASRAAMITARNKLLAIYGGPGSGFNRTSGTVSLAGVGFFDTLRGQMGAARNGVELHPVLSMSRVRPTTGPAG